MAVVLEQVLVHPTQASRVRLRVFDRPPDTHVAGMSPDRSGYLVTEERIGSRTVVNTLGFLPTQQEALERLRDRAGELERQRYRPATPAA